MKLRLAPTTARFITSFSMSLPHAVLLTGPEGVGLHTLAEHLARQNGRILADIIPESKTGSSLRAIPVERIRQLYVETRSKLDGTNFVIIDDADHMNHVAQNALLKLLEEPNASICFILTSHTPDKLLPTIRSRVQQCAVAPISEVESKRLLEANGVKDATTIQRLLYVATGLPAELTRLLQNKSAFTQLLERVGRAKLLIEATPYQRLAASVRYMSDRQEALHIIDTALLLLRRSLAANPHPDTIRKIDSFVQASESIRANGNVKLQLARAVVQ